MKKFFIRLTILVAPLASIIITTNIYTDPANIFSGEKYVEQIATILASGNNANNVSNYDERLLQEKFLTKQTQKPDILIMGSSRIMQISSNIFPDKKLFNIGVSHANNNDLIALAGLIDSLKLMPSEVVVNVDPFLISKGDKGASEWQTLQQYHSYFSKKYCSNISTKTVDEDNNNFKKFYSIFSFDYFKQSVNFLLKKGDKKIYNVGKKIPELSGRFSDGSVAYDYAYSHPDTILIATVGKRMGEIFVPDVDENKLNSFNCFLDFLKNKNIKVTLIMLPFQPDYFDETNRKQNNIFNTSEAFFINLAKQRGLPIIGSLSPVKCNVHRIDFYDSYHCSADAIKRIYESNTLKK